MSNETESRKDFAEWFEDKVLQILADSSVSYSHFITRSVTTEHLRHELMGHCYDAWKARDSEVNKLREEVERLRNQLELSEEDIDCVHMWLDDCSIPRSKGDNTYSIVGRIQCLLEVKAAKETSK